MEKQSLLALRPDASSSFLKKLSVTAVTAIIAAGCSTSPVTQQANEASATRIAPTERLMPTVVSRSQIRKSNPTTEQRAAMMSGSHAGLSARRIDMASLADAPASAGGDAVAVGGSMIESKMSDEEVQAAIANAMQNAPATGMQTLADGSDNLAVNNEGKGRGRGKPGPKLRAVIDSIGGEDCCVDDVPFTATVPPDPDLAVGPDHIIAVVNVAFEIYDKKGNVLRPATSFGTLFAGVEPIIGACEGSGPFDPDVIYDESIGQYIMGVDGAGFFYCIGITTDGDPMGDWNLYAFFATALDPAGNFEFFDFPHMGAGTDAIFVGSNQFDTFGFAGGAVFAVNKDELLNGGPLNVLRANVPNFDSTPQPATNFGAAEGTLPTSDTNYIMTEVFDGRVHSVYQWNDPWGGGALELVGDVNLADASGVACDLFSCFPVSVPQAGSSLLLAGNDWRGQETRYRNGSLWTTQHISCNPTGEPGAAVNCVRWAEVNPDDVEPLTGLNENGQLDASTNGVVQAGVFSSGDGVHRWFPSIGVNACGQMAVGYSKSSADMFPSVAMTGQRAEDRAGKVRGETEVISGTEPYRSFQSGVTRWGDYSGMWVDPNGKDFWYIGEYAGPSDNPFINWQNAIAKANFGCGFSKKGN